MNVTTIVTMKSISQILRERGLNERGEAQKFVDSEVLRRCEPYVPRDLGNLITSGIRSTVLGSGIVSYSTPYARKWYYTPANFQGAPMRGNFWFERMKKEGGKDAILQGLKEKVGL